MEAQTEKYLSRRDVAEVLGVPEKTVAQWAFKKTGPKFYKIGRYSRYVASDVTAWVESQQTGGTQECA